MGDMLQALAHSKLGIQGLIDRSETTFGMAAGGKEDANIQFWAEESKKIAYDLLII
jgi:hypothetical protein